MWFVKWYWVGHPGLQTFSKLWDNISWIFYTSRSGDNQWTAWRRNKKNIAAQFMFIVRCIEAETIGTCSPRLRIRIRGIQWGYRSVPKQFWSVFVPAIMSYRFFFLKTFNIKSSLEPIYLERCDPDPFFQKFGSDTDPLKKWSFIPFFIIKCTFVTFQMQMQKSQCFFLLGRDQRKTAWVAFRMALWDEAILSHIITKKDIYFPIHILPYPLPTNKKIYIS